MRVVYLDQNQWIQLARVQHGKTSDARLGAALRAVRQAGDTEAAAFPLSAVHYMETARVGQPRRRARLGRIMWTLSKGQTLASYRSILTHELETALARRFPTVRPAPFSLVSVGAAHAFGMEARPFRFNEEVRRRYPPAVVERLERAASVVMERALVTGEGPPGDEMPMATFGYTDHNTRFQEHLRSLRPRLTEHLTPDRWDDALYAISLADILEPLNEVIARFGLSAEDVGTTRAQLCSLVDDLPSRRVDVHLHRQILRNPGLRPKLNDLEDWAALAPAAAHCDVVVCEKHFANLLSRDGFVPKAKMLTDVRQLPDVLDT